MTKTKSTDATPVLSPIAALRQQLEASRKQVMKIQPQPLTRVADRKAEIERQLREFDLDGLRELVGDEYINLITTFIGDETILNEKFAEIVMRQALATKQLSELSAVVWEKMIKPVVFDSMSATLAEDPDVEDPVHTNAKIKVAAMMMEFSREATGVDVSANIPALKKLLEKAGINWESVFNVEVKRVYTLNTDALWDVIKDSGTLQDEVLTVIVETPKAGRLNMRPLQPGDVEQ